MFGMWVVARGDVARDGPIVRVASDGAWMHVAAVAEAPDTPALLC